ncbi:MAG: major capsid protein [Defluviitaleaceae bacterium]|nr:major capsid protein [Defluviitaleaceae bacterium]
MREKVAEKSPLIRSGAVVNSEALANLASRGGRTVNMPYWNRISVDSEVLSMTGALNPTPVTARADVAAINFRAAAWSIRELASAIAGDSALAAIAEMVAEYWVRDEQKVLVSSLAGAFASPGMSGHVFGAANPGALNAEMVLDAKQLLGDVFGQLHAIVMHSAVYTSLQKQDLITFMRPSTGARIAEYLGYDVIVDDSVQYDEAGKVFSTYLLAEGAIGRGDGTPVDMTPVEVSRSALLSEDYLITRKALIMHPLGIAFTGAVVSGESPSNAELRNPVNWNRVHENKNIGMIEIKHTIQ